MPSYEIDYHDRNIYPMGLTGLDHGIHISVPAAGQSCSLVLYLKDTDIPEHVIPFPPELRQGDVWRMTLLGDGFESFLYGFLVDGEWLPDPYGREFCGREIWGKTDQVHEKLKAAINGEEYDWAGDKPPGLPYEECIIYHIHTRGLTRHASYKGTDKGTFQAIIETIPYMKEIGITTVELMPPVEFQEVMLPEYQHGSPYGRPEPTGRLNYWGYTKACYFAPKASYCPGKDKHPVRAMKDLVRALHRAGLELVIELYFTGREQPSFVLDVVRFWVREYHVDGVHLIGEVPAGLIGTDPYLSKTKLWAADWGGCDGGHTKHLAEYNDGFLIDMRRILKGDEDQINTLIFRTRHNPGSHGVINYIANTNGFTLMDMVSYDMKHNEANGEQNQDGTDYNYSWNCGSEGPVRRKKVRELRRQQIRNALALLFLSQGTPLLLAGDEFGNSQSGNNNSYCQDNEISWLNWNQLKTNQDLFEFTKQIIALRKRHPVFKSAAEPRVLDYLACGYPDVSYHGVRTWHPEFENFRRQLGILYCGEYGKKADGSSDNYFFIAYNMHWEPHEFALPKLPARFAWHVAVNTSLSEVNGIYPEGKEPKLKDQKRFMVTPRTIVVFMGS